MINKLMAALAVTLISMGTSVLTIEGLTPAQKIAAMASNALGAGLALAFQPRRRKSSNVK